MSPESFPEGVTDDAVTAHLYYEENAEKLDLQCISCHLDVGHYNPNYAHGQMVGIPGMTGSIAVDTSRYFKEATPVSTFADYREQIPGTAVSFLMRAIKGGTFKMGSPENEPFRNPDESPQHEVSISPFFMAEVETTWDMYWAFYAETMSEGRTPPEMVYENNLTAMGVDAISGPTPPFGYPDQGWGQGDRPAITMTHYAAETFCQWLSSKTGKKYRLPTEAEWEYARPGEVRRQLISFQEALRIFLITDSCEIFSNRKLTASAPMLCTRRTATVAHNLPLSFCRIHTG